VGGNDDLGSKFLVENAPAGYANENYYGCYLSNTDVLLAIFAIMMAGEGFSMAGEPATKFQQARLAAAKVPLSFLGGGRRQ